MGDHAATDLAVSPTTARSGRQRPVAAGARPEPARAPAEPIDEVADSVFGAPSVTMEPMPHRSDATGPGLTTADRERLARRYPAPLLPRPALIGIVAVVAAASLGWLIWAALVHAQPVVSANVAAYTVVSDRRIDATVTIDRTDPSVPVVCRVSAQAEDFQPVGELNLPVEATTERVVNVGISITTLRRATTAVIRECSPA